MKNIEYMQEWLEQRLAESRAEHGWLGKIRFDLRLKWIKFRIQKLEVWMYQIEKAMNKLIK